MGNVFVLSRISLSPLISPKFLGCFIFSSFCLLSLSSCLISSHSFSPHCLLGNFFFQIFSNFVLTFHLLSSHCFFSFSFTSPEHYLLSLLSFYLPLPLLLSLPYCVISSSMSSSPHCLVFCFLFYVSRLDSTCLIFLVLSNL